MTQTKRSRRAAEALLRGEPVDFSGWPADEVAAALDCAIAKWERLLNDGRRRLEELKKLETTIRTGMAQGELALAQARAARAALIDGRKD